MKNQKKPELIKDLGMMYPTPTSNQKKHYGIYKCNKCGKKYKCRVDSVASGKNKSCIHCAMQNIGGKHGLYGTRIYNIWHGIKARCLNEKGRDYAMYGGQGVSLYKGWIEFVGFLDWAIKNGYKENLSIDRINPYGNYEPNNCRWTTKTIQSRNIRKLQKNNTSGYKGVSWDKNKKKWTARITVNYKGIHVGYFNTAKEAGLAYDNYIIANNLEHTKNFTKKTK